MAEEIEEHTDDEEKGTSLNNLQQFNLSIKKNKRKTVIAMQLFFKNVEIEAIETITASKIVVKYVRHGKISKDEEKELRTQIYDIFKAVGIGVPFMLIPGSIILIPFLLKIAKKRGIDLLPSAFTKEIENRVNTENPDSKETPPSP